MFHTNSGNLVCISHFQQCSVWTNYIQVLNSHIWFLATMLDSSTLGNGHEKGKLLNLIEIQKLKCWKYSISRV